MNQEIINILFNFLPEITLALSIIILNLKSGFNNNNTASSYFIFTAGISLSFLFTLIQAFYAPQLLFSGLISADHFSYGARVLILLSMLIITLGFYNKNDFNDATLILISVTGALLSVSSSDIFAIFLSLLVMVIPLYLIIYYSIKPAIKYFIFSSTAMAVLLYGLTVFYGITGTGSLTGISLYLSFNPFNNLILVFAVITVTCGFTFISLLAPFNLSFPLIAGKLRTRHIGQFAIVNITAIMLVMSRFYLSAFNDRNTFITDTTRYNIIPAVKWQLLLAIISGISIIAGNFILLWQYDLKKIFSFITIAQAGYILIGIISLTPVGLSSVFFNLIIFILNSSGLLLCINLINKKYKITNITGLKSLGKTDKYLMLAFIFFLICSAGFPLSGGFTGKIMLYVSLGSSNYLWLIAAGILSSAVYIFFVFRLSINIFSGKNSLKLAKNETIDDIILLFLLIPLIFTGIYFEPVLNWAKYCSNIFGL